MTTVSSFTTAAGFQKEGCSFNRFRFQPFAFGSRLLLGLNHMGEFVLQGHFQMRPTRWAGIPAK